MLRPWCGRFGVVDAEGPGCSPPSYGVLTTKLVVDDSTSQAMLGWIHDFPSAPSGSPPVKRTSLEASGLDIEPEVVWNLFAPFITGEADGAWRRDVARRRRKLVRRTISRLLTGQVRDRATVLAEYDPSWRAIDYGIYDPARHPGRGEAWTWRGRNVFAHDVGSTRFRQLFLCRVMERLKPRSVLEVGCGNGINLILLSDRFPEISFTGVELTAIDRHASHRKRLARLRILELPAIDPLAVAVVLVHDAARYFVW